MIAMTKTHVGRLRLIALIEGVSFLVLLFVAMPLKYGLGIDSAVRWTGWAHGVLFILFCIALAVVFQITRWPLWKYVVIFIAALVPFGPFLIDKRLKHEDPETA